MLSLALFLSFTAPWFMTILVGKEFYGSVRFIFWLALGKGIYSMYFMTCNYLFYMEKTVLVAFSTFSAAVIHIVSTYYFIKINGVIGAAQAGIISTSVLVCMTWYFSNRIYKMPWSLHY
jgi:O-antigen/teichoic acid export membrane protein